MLFRNRVYRRRGFKRRDLLVFLLVLGAGMGQVVVWVAQQRDTARRLECVNNMKVLGIGFHVYHDANDSFPTEAWPDRVSFYTTLFPYVQGSNTPTPPTNEPVRIFQ